MLLSAPFWFPRGVRAISAKVGAQGLWGAARWAWPDPHPFPNGQVKAAEQLWWWWQRSAKPCGQRSSAVGLQRELPGRREMAVAERDLLIPARHGWPLGCSTPSGGSSVGDSAFIQGSTRPLFLHAVLCQQHVLGSWVLTKRHLLFPCPGRVALDCSELGNSWPFVSMASFSDSSVQKSVGYSCFW